jgi:uncharacterized protein (DUF488 family)
MELYTIGHSAHPIEVFVGLLRLHQVRLVVDVRSIPASRFHPQYGKKRLADSLAEAGLGYTYLGEALGGRPGDPALYPDGMRRQPGDRFPRPDYTRVAQRPDFLQTIDRLLALAAAERTAILCSEEDPARCHRHLLIAAYLAVHAPEVRVWHIRGSGALEDARMLGLMAE